MSEYTVLITGAGSPGMPGVLKCLRKVNDTRFRYIGADMNENAACKHEFSDFFRIPAAASPDFTDAIFQICREQKVDLVVPCVTRELYKLAQAKEQFARIGTVIAVMDIDKLKTVNNKGALLEFAGEKNLGAPEFCIIEHPDELPAAAKKMGYPEKPFVIKGCEGNGSRAVRVVMSYHDLAQNFFEDKPNGALCDYETVKHILTERHPWPCKMMVMEYLPGTEYAVDILAERGKIKAMVCRRATLVVSSNQMQCVIERNPAVENICRAVVEELKLDGNIGFDLKENEAGEPKIMEINPRFTGGIVACCAAGINFPHLGICSWLGIDQPVPEVQCGVRMVRRLEELFFDADDRQITI